MQAVYAINIKFQGMPELESLFMNAISASDAAIEAVYEAHGWARRARREEDV